MRETRMSADTLIYPLFVMEGENRKEEIASMPGQYRYSIDRLSEETIASAVGDVNLHFTADGILVIWAIECSDGQYQIDT